MILSFRTSLQNERESLSGLPFGMQRDNVVHHTSVSNSILYLQISHAHENKVVDTFQNQLRK